MRTLLTCAYNMDNCCVELKFTAWHVSVIVLQKPLNMERKVLGNQGIIYRRTGIGYRANEKSKN